MASLLFGLALFLGIHSVRIVAEEFRARQVARLGLNAWKGIYTLVALAGFVLLSLGYDAARQAPVELWAPPVWTRHLAALLTLPAFVLATAAYVPGTVIRAKTGHPLLLATKLWAFAHLVANGSVADVALFGSILVWAIACFAAARRRDRAAGVTYPAAGIARDLIAVAAGTAGWGVFAFFLHARLIGVAPFG